MGVILDTCNNSWEHDMHAVISSTWLMSCKPDQSIHIRLVWHVIYTLADVFVAPAQTGYKQDCFQTPFNTWECMKWLVDAISRIVEGFKYYSGILKMSLIVWNFWSYSSWICSSYWNWRESDPPFMTEFRANVKGMANTPLLAFFSVAGEPGTASKWFFF